MEDRNCKLGESCTFAHGAEELATGGAGRVRGGAPLTRDIQRQCPCLSAKIAVPIALAEELPLKHEARQGEVQEKR